MTGASRQDVQNMLDNARSRLVDQLATKQDVQRLTDSSRDRIISYMHDFLLQNQQQFIRQLDVRTKVYKDRLAALDSHVQALEQEVRATRQLLEQMSVRQQSTATSVAQQKQMAGRTGQYRFGYSPT